MCSVWKRVRACAAMVPHLATLINQAAETLSAPATQHVPSDQPGEVEPFDLTQASWSWCSADSTSKHRPVMLRALPQRY